MIKRFNHNRFAIAALLASLLFGMIEVAAPWLSGTTGANLHNPVGHLVGFVTKSFMSAPSLVRAGSDRAELTLWLFLGAKAVLIALLIGCLWWRTHSAIRRSTWVNDSLIASQMLIGIVLDSLVFSLIVAAQLAAFMPLRRSLVWLVLQYLLGVGVDMYLALDSRLGLSDEKIRMTLAYLSFERLVQVLAFGLAFLVRLERRARLSLTVSHAELLATQSLLGDTVRASERMRIARDLHDVVGHHLTALKLHLDLAFRQSDGKAAESLHTSRELAQVLLAEVRAVVSTERHDQCINLREALQTLCAGIPEPAIRLTVADNVEIHSPAAAHTLFFCVQEAITNAVRHAGADLLTIDIACRDGNIVVAIADDGRGSRHAAEGNGIRGMRERVVQQCGLLTAGDLPQRGYGLEIRLPAAGVAA